LQGVPDPTATVTLDALYEAYRNWFKNEGLRGKPVTRTDLRTNLEIIWKQKAIDNKWSGLSIIQPTQPAGFGGFGVPGGPGAMGNIGGSLLKF